MAGLQHVQGVTMNWDAVTAITLITLEVVALGAVGVLIKRTFWPR